jgi:3-oxosteroid 1-dehydrogenase
VPPPRVHHGSSPKFHATRDTLWFALSERNAPGSIIVNAAGERYMNEALPYVEATHRMYGAGHGQGPGPGENLPSWMIPDQQCRDRYLFAGLQGGQRFPRKWLGSGVVVTADTIAELAQQIGWMSTG